MADSEISSGVGQELPPDVEAPRLSDLLDRGWKLFEQVNSTDEPLGSSSVQLSVKRAITLLEEASRMAAQLDLFSRNEELEEVATADLKYLLCPALLGALTMKQSSRDQRLEIVQTARGYYMDFLRRCKEYNISQFHLPKNDNTSPGEMSENGHLPAKSVSSQPDLVAMAAQRQAKIERYRQRKELEAKLSDMRRAVDSGQADDEVSRDFYLLSVRKWVTVCLEDVESIDQELLILKNMDSLKQGAASQPPQPSTPTMKPFILTRDALQAHVFGAGYPSLPTMTVDDWYDQHRKHGVLPDQGLPRRVAAEDDREQEEEAKEKMANDDDEETVQKARDWDDWKDSHRRGYGNRHNMG